MVLYTVYCDCKGSKNCCKCKISQWCSMQATRDTPSMAQCTLSSSHWPDLLVVVRGLTDGEGNWTCPVPEVELVADRKHDDVVEGVKRERCNAQRHIAAVHLTAPALQCNVRNNQKFKIKRRQFSKRVGVSATVLLGIFASSLLMPKFWTSQILHIKSK